MGNDKNNLKKRKRNYETVGRLKGIFTVNFEHSEEILDLIDPLFESKGQEISSSGWPAVYLNI